MLKENIRIYEKHHQAYVLKEMCILRSTFSQSLPCFIYPFPCFGIIGSWRDPIISSTSPSCPDSDPESNPKSF